MKVIIDTDPGIDDAMAILFALAHPDITVLGLTSIFGNVPTDTATRNALVLAEIAGANIPVAPGAKVPLSMPPRPHADFVHGSEGFGDIPALQPKGHPLPVEAADFLIRSCAARPGEVVIVAIGPLTNLALALQRAPEIAETAGRVIVMGGSLTAGGNATAHAEANIVGDPHAAAMVFDAPWTVDIVGLDVTNQVQCSSDDFAALAATSPDIGGFLHACTDFYIRFYETRHGAPFCSLHDPSALIAGLRPELFGWTQASVAVTLEGDAIGATTQRVGVEAAGTRWARTVEQDAVRALFLETLATARHSVPWRHSVTK